MNPIVESLLLRSAVLFLIVGSLAGLVVGALLLWNPFRLRAIGNVRGIMRDEIVEHPLELCRCDDAAFRLDPARDHDWGFRHRYPHGSRGWRPGYRRRLRLQRKTRVPLRAR